MEQLANVLDERLLAVTAQQVAGSISDMENFMERIIDWPLARPAIDDRRLNVRANAALAFVFGLLIDLDRPVFQTAETGNETANLLLKVAHRRPPDRPA